MKVCILGDSHAPEIFRHAAWIKGLFLTYPQDAALIVVAQDTGIDKNGERNLRKVRKSIRIAQKYSAPIILTSQVPPGFCRKLNDHRIYHQSETLRIKDALERAVFPEQIIIGIHDRNDLVPGTVNRWCATFTDNVVWCSYETAEFSKMAINMTLASQVENTNRLSEAAKKVGADWSVIKRILGNDKRIGPHSYLDPGDWQQSKHLLRDYITLKSYG